MRCVVFQSDEFTSEVLTSLGDDGSPVSFEYLRAEGSYGSYDPSTLEDNAGDRLMPVEGVATLRAWVRDWPGKPHGKAYVGSMGIMLEKGADWPQTFMEIDAYLSTSASDPLHRTMGRCDGREHYLTMVAHAASTEMTTGTNKYGDSAYEMRGGELRSASFYETRFSAQPQRLEHLNVSGVA